MASAQPAVRIDSLEKRYASGTLALKGVSFDVEEGEFFGLLGPNGAGKTTLISCLGGLTTPTGRAHSRSRHGYPYGSTSRIALSRHRAAGNHFRPVSDGA